MIKLLKVVKNEQNTDVTSQSIAMKKEANILANGMIKLFCFKNLSCSKMPF